MIFDGTTMTMPDTEKKRAKFGKHTCQYGAAGFPQLRLVVLMVGATHLALDAAFAACRGKDTGERSLMKQILARLTRRGCLLLFDAGFYCFDLAWTLIGGEQHFIMQGQSESDAQADSGRGLERRQFPGSSARQS